jgi:uncharacterized protein YbbC (DUF1343 family)
MKKMLLISLLIIISTMSCFSLSKIKLGIDVLVEENFKHLDNKNIALLSNFAGRSSDGILSSELLAKANNCRLKMVLAPEHGFFTTVPAGQHIADTLINGIPIISLYGKNREPNKKLLEDVDVIVVDIQDIGIRSYTFLSTIFNTMKVAAENNIKVLVLDRPNPLGGIIVDGNVIESEWFSFVGIVPISYIHGCTIGELALMINNEKWLSQDKTLQCDLEIVKMIGWQRGMAWEETGLDWYPTSPHIPTVNSARGMAIFGAFGELGITSLGIGTTTPFQIVGHKTFDLFSENHPQIADKYSSFSTSPMIFRPFYGKYKDENINGLFMTFHFDDDSKPYQDGMNFFMDIRKNYPLIFDRNLYKADHINMFKKVTGTSEIFDIFFGDTETGNITEIITKNLYKFIILRNNYLLY